MPMLTYPGPNTAPTSPADAIRRSRMPAARGVDRPGRRLALAHQVLEVIAQAGLALQPADAVAVGDHALGDALAQVLGVARPHLVQMHLAVGRLVVDLIDALDVAELVGDLL